jgi:glyoxylase-like metal-dependent hydrolase (beta-lactamase superfamily II)/ferredoxin
MARLDQRHPDNVDGEWFCDTRCIDCDVARHYAPGLIEADDEGLSVVVRQPASPAESAALWRAALACPTRSIGTRSGERPPAGVFPWHLTDGVYLCGHNDRSSFGAHSYFVVRPDGNLLVDAPRWTSSLAASFEERGGIDHVLLSHRDDVADAQRYAERFDATVWIHEDDEAAAPFATDTLTGDEVVDVAPGVTAIPSPGHTAGSVLYLVDGAHLFTGDTLYWNHRRGHLDVFGGATWHSWEALGSSIARLASVARFSWVLPGHGKWGTADPGEFAEQVRLLAEEMPRHDRFSWDRRP